MLAPVALLAAAALAAPAPTTARIGVFSDQLPDGMPPALVAFAAAHYDGAQKLGATLTDELKARNPRFFAVQYRLGLGLGRRTQVRFGDTWRPEWPARPQARWFYRYRGSRVFQRSWGWYLMNPDDASWRAYYVAQLRLQVASTHADGAFLDSTSVPNALGADSFAPRLPAYDPRWELGWTRRIERWLPFVQRRLGRPVIVNAGSWVTTRDRTDYSAAAGVMIEGFATGLAPDDWRLELTRALGLVRRGRIVICQSYPAVDDVRARLFDLASYLLVKGDHTYVNFAEGIRVSWFPEYALDLGASVDPPGLRQEGGAYARRFANGLVLANPGPQTVTVPLPATMREATPSGGGAVPTDGAAPGSLSYVPVSSVTLRPDEGAILVR